MQFNGTTLSQGVKSNPSSLSTKLAQFHVCRNVPIKITFSTGIKHDNCLLNKQKITIPLTVMETLALLVDPTVLLATHL